MSFHLVTEPIDRWPLPDTPNREGIRFSASYSATLNVLNRELDHLGATGPVVLQVVTCNGASDIRRDGALRAQAKIAHPGVRLSFESKHGPLTYATDRFQGRWAGQIPDWQANLRAIALGLEALRTVDRYGISRSGEQYRGWRAIEAGDGTEDAPLDVLRYYASLHADPVPTDIQQLVRAARIGAHPDRHGGDHSGSNEVLAAITALGLDGAQ